MVAFVGLDNETPVEVDVERLASGAGKVACFECGGSGRNSFWPEFSPDPACLDCKGTGFVLVSV